MRVHDSLQQGASLFYAAISRIKSVVELTDGDIPLLFLLDEILQGTNSHDRRVGAEGIIRQLIERGAIGVVTTHDLALTEIVNSFDRRAVNMHFEDHLVDGKMTFDYQLRPGVVERSNALELMRMVGLAVDVDKPKAT
jgi:DNA mismatch repair ATPase MutS